MFLLHSFLPLSSIMSGLFLKVALALFPGKRVEVTICVWLRRK